MNCKDCIHNEVCNELYFAANILQPDCCDCDDFKDKSRFIELPCKVGDRVYILNRDKTKVREMVFDKPDIRCHCTKDDEFSCCMPICNDYHNGICAYRFNNDFSDIGKTVFLTREEAEKTLKKLEK